MSMDYPLSVIIPTYNRQEKVIRAVQSVFEQDDPIGTQVIVSDDGSTDQTIAELSKRFAPEMKVQKLGIVRAPRTGDPGSTRNAGAKASRAQHLAFLDSDDTWENGRLMWLSPLLEQYQLILGYTPDEPVVSTDPLLTLLKKNVAITSSAVIARNLFENLGGFSTFYYGPYKKKIPGWEDYELWLKAVIRLKQQGASEKVLMVPDPLITREKAAECSAGAVGIKNQMMREAFTLMRVLGKMPLPYWKHLPRRLGGALKAGLLG